MEYCGQCGAPLAAEHRFCPTCGAQRSRLEQAEAVRSTDELSSRRRRAVRRKVSSAATYDRIAAEAAEDAVRGYGRQRQEAKAEAARRKQTAARTTAFGCLGCLGIIGVIAVIAAMLASTNFGSISTSSTSSPPSSTSSTSSTGSTGQTTQDTPVAIPTPFPSDTPLPPAAAHAQATADAELFGSQRHAIRTFDGPKAVQQPGGQLLFSQLDLGESFKYEMGSPQINVYSASEWDAFEYMVALPEPDTGLSSISVAIDHDASASKARQRLRDDIGRTMNGDAAGIHRRVYPTDSRTGVEYLRLISDEGGYWYAAYDALFTVGKYRNTISVLVNINGPIDRVFGYTGLNSFVDQLTQREQGT